jgi:excisionase family DNA binding protein
MTKKSAHKKNVSVAPAGPVEVHLPPAAPEGAAITITNTDPEKPLVVVPPAQEKITLPSGDTAAFVARKPRSFTPAEVAARLGVGRSKVMTWITTKQIRAVNVAAAIGGGKRARWRIDEADLLAFEASRANCPGPGSPGAAVPAAGPTGAKAKRLRRQVTEFIE